jgi:putative phosphoribosyl transferase
MTTLRTPTDLAIPVRVPLDEMALHGDLQSPEDPIGLVIFVHGSGSSRFSPRNRYVAGELNKRGLATLLLDLLTEEEHKVDAETMQLRFDIPLLAERSTLVANWAHSRPDLRNLPIGLFGASTGAAAALITAAALPAVIASVVSRGGRPDLAQIALAKVKAPTLLIVGGEDHQILELNRESLAQLRCNKKLHVVPGATHLFEERGTLEQVAKVAGEWFQEHLVAAAHATKSRLAG